MTATRADLGLLASAIAGRSVRVEDTDGLAWTDGATIYVPEEDPIRKLAVQASLIAAGSLTEQRLRPLGRSRERARRYLAAEGYRALAANETVLPPAAKALLLDEPTDEPPEAFGEIRPGDIADDGIDLSVLSSLSVGRGGPIGRLLARMLRPGRGERTNGAIADAPTHMAWASPVDEYSAPHLSTAPMRTATDTIASDGTSYPEWDASRGTYRNDWCTVLEADATATAVAAPIEHAHALAHALTRVEVGLMPVRRRAQGDDVDIDAAIESLVDARAGVAGSDDVYVETLRRRRDLSVVVLLDVSGSANEAAPDARRVHDHQVALAAALATTLHGLGDRVALYAFNSRGRTAVQMTRVKSFDAPLDAQVHARLAALKPAAYTRLGAAIRHATSIACTQSGTPRRLLVVISDGFAYDHGYEGSYGEADARRALAEARNASVGCVCLSVGTDGDVDALQRVFGTAAHAQVPRVDDVPAVIGPLFRSAMRRIR